MGRTGFGQTAEVRLVPLLNPAIWPIWRRKLLATRPILA